MNITPANNERMNGKQIRAARAFLGLSQADLCELAGITRPTLNAIESDKGDPKRSSLAAVEAALREKGVRFVDDGRESGILVSHGERDERANDRPARRRS